MGWLAGAHVAAKRYLVATDPDYATTLSDVSVDSLHHQGGADVDPAFVDHPWWPDALRLRRYDDAAKDPQAMRHRSTTCWWSRNAFCRKGIPAR